MSKLYPDEIGSGNPVRLLATVRQAGGSTRASYLDTFDGTELGDDWSLDASSSALPSVAGGYAYSTDSSQLVAVLDAQSSFDATASYTLTMDCSIPTPTGISSFSDTRWEFYVKMDDTTPDISDEGVTVYVDLDTVGGVVSRTAGISVFSGASEVESYSNLIGSDSKVSPFVFSVTVAGSVLTVKIDGTTYLTQAISTSLSGKRLGFGFDGCVASNALRAGSFGFDYGVTASVEYRQRFIASANAKLYYENDSGSLTEIGDYTGSGSTAALASDRRLRAVELGGKLYIADWSEPSIEGSAGTITGTNTLDDASVSDWTSYASAYDYAAELFNHDNSGDGVYPITAVSSGSITLDGSPANTSSSTSYRIIRCPKYYDPSEDKLYSWTQEVEDAATGQMPLGCKLIARHLGRIAVAGAEANPNILYMSRQNNALDWDYSEDDAQAAAATSTTLAGVIGSPITALIEGGDDYLLVGCRDQIYVLRGNPKAGGFIDTVSLEVGVVGADAWCRTPDMRTIFLARNGVYAIPPNASGRPEPLSDNPLPQALRNLGENDDVQLAYDAEDNGVHIFVERGGGGKEDYWLDLKYGAFWPYSYATNPRPTCLRLLSIDTKDRNVVAVGGSDGHVRYFDEDAAGDDGTEFESYVTYGPFRLWDSYNAGILNELVATLGDESDDVTYDVYTAADAESASELSDSSAASILAEDSDEITAEDGTTLITNTTVGQGTWSRGRNYSHYPRALGGACVLRVRGTGTPWAMEGVTALIHDAGKQRVL